jgi:hypothetical protein
MHVREGADARASHHGDGNYYVDTFRLSPTSQRGTAPRWVLGKRVTTGPCMQATELGWGPATRIINRDFSRSFLRHSDILTASPQYVGNESATGGWTDNRKVQFSVG